MESPTNSGCYPSRMLSAAVATLLVHTAIGMLACAAIARSPAGPGFYRLTLLIGHACLCLGLGLRVGGVTAALPLLTPLAAAGYALSVAAVILFAIKLRPQTVPDFMWLYVAALAGVAAVAVDPALRGWSGDIGGFGATLYVAGLAGAVAAVGSVLFAMLLAHWYLIEPRMPLAPLRRVLIIFAATQVLLVVQLVAVVVSHWPAWTSMDGGLVRAFTLGNALFVAMRGFLGVLAPIMLAWMTWKTVEIRSIQSATGILYAAVVFVLFGETICIYLSLASGQPY